jgi:hypothetical protein
MLGYKQGVCKVSFVSGKYEVSPITDDWDKGSDFDETTYYHLLMLDLQAVDET